MKKIAGMLILSSLCLSQAYAQTNVNDTSAVLSVNGALTNSAAACAVDISENSLHFQSRPEDLKEQDKVNQDGLIVMLTVTDSEYCRRKITDNQIRFTFMGEKDNAHGTVLANQNNSESAAKGVGVGVFDYNGIPVDINTGTVRAVLPFTRVLMNMVKLSGQDVIPGDYQGTMTIEIQRI